MSDGRWAEAALGFVFLLSTFHVPLAASLNAQEVLLPLAATQKAAAKNGTDTMLTLPFFDDFAGYTGTPCAARWQGGGAVVNTGYAPLPPTVGMMTLDAADATGCLYGHATTSLFGADTATSLMIRLDAYAPQDSVVLSFYYLPGGGSGNLWERIGDAPEAQDSLFVDFYSAADSAWHTVWRRGGTTVETLMQQTGHDWQYACIAVTDSVYFDSTFRFRIRNLASLDDNGLAGAAGNCDQWNIDYVRMDAGRNSTTEEAVRDVAFVQAAPSMLASYRAMPARQYRSSEMAQNVQMTIANRYSSALASQYEYVVTDENGDTLHHYDGGYENAPSYMTTGGYQTAQAHAAPPVGFAFAEGQNHREYTIQHTVREGTGGDEHRDNDTVRFSQVFADYYAYDDGTAENGYGLTSTSAHIYLAYRFDLNETDTLTAVDIYFNSTLGAQNEHVWFYMTVWQCGADGRPATVLYRDSDKRRATGTGFGRYALDYALTVSDRIFVGFEQVGSDYINIGFDRSWNSAERVWYLTSTEWQQSILSGSLMLRPCFGSDAVGIASVDVQNELSIWPNPASQQATIDGMVDGDRAEIYDLMGRRMASTVQKTIDTREWPDGVYIVRLRLENGATTQRKLIIKH